MRQWLVDNPAPAGLFLICALVTVVHMASGVIGCMNVVPRSGEGSVVMDRHQSYVVSPRGSSASLWVHLSWDGRNPDLPSTLPDGRNWEEIVATDGLSGLPSGVWFEPWNSGRPVDWLWPGLSERVFSRALVDVFISCGVTGMETLPLTIRRKRRPDIEGYSLVRFTGDDQVEYFPNGNPYGYSLLVSETIRNELLARKMTGISVESAQRAWEGYVENAGSQADPEPRDR